MYKRLNSFAFTSASMKNQTSSLFRSTIDSNEDDGDGDSDVDDDGDGEVDIAAPDWVNLLYLAIEGYLFGSMS